MAMTKTIVLGHDEIMVVAGSAPAEGEGAGTCPRRSICVEIGEGLMGRIWRNRGTRAWPVWDEVGTLSGPIGRGPE
jgi:hypothetical protein